MKKNFITVAIAIITVATMFFASAANAQIIRQIDEERNRSVVVVNGVSWARFNVGTSGVFVSAEEEAGDLYSWREALDACPAGWRLPTKSEFWYLIEAGSVWTERNGVSGRLFGIAPNQIFLPAAGLRTAEGVLHNATTDGRYWSGTPSGNTHAMRLNIRSRRSGVVSGARSFRFSVRCVAE